VSVFSQLDEYVASGFLQRHVAGARQLLRKIAEAADAVGALGKRRVELEQRALEKPELRRHLAIAQDLQRAAHERHHLIDPCLRGRGAARPSAAFTAAAAGQVLVGDELVTVALHHDARERTAADDEDLLVVLFEFFDERNEVAVAAHDDVGVDVRVRERHLERIEREVDIRAVLVASRRQVALDQFRGVLRERAAVISCARPVTVRGFGNDLASFLERLEHDTDIELAVERALDSDLDIVEVDEDCDFQTCVCQTLLTIPSGPGAKVPLSRTAARSR
jgi:hypothetical protein